MSHFDEMTCLLYLEGQLERPRALELAAHIEVCADCRALLRALERESRLLEQALVEEDESVPARLLAPPARKATPWAWIVSFGLAAAGAYTLWTSIVEPWRQQLNQAGLGETNLLTMLFFGGVLWKGWGAMANTVEYLAITTLGILTFVLLRRRWRRWTTIAVVMGAVAAALALPPAAGAAEVRHTQVYTLARDEVVKNDLIVSAETTRIDGTVEGDLIFFSRSVTVNGHVAGDVIGFGEYVRVNGPVDGNLRVFCKHLSLSSTIGKNVSAFVQQMEFDSKSLAGGSVMLFVNDATLEGRVGRDLQGVIHRVSLNGFVGGNLQMRAETLNIGPTAEVAGKASYRGPRQPNVSPQAKLASPLDVQIVHRRPSYLSARFYWHQALGWGAAFVFGLVLVLLLPGIFAEVVHSARWYGPSFGFGALVLFATPILAVIACVTIVGLAVGIGTLLLWLVALYSAQVFVGAWMGKTLLGAPAGTGAMIGRLAVGLLVLRLLCMVPFLGGLVKLAVLLWGLGALALAVYDRSRTRAPAAA
jgi:cytoskeletal protein CcmA (bactofilin family)